MKGLNKIIEGELFQTSKGKLDFVVGKDENENSIIKDLTKTSHILIGGTTNSGKSMFLNSMIISLLKKHNKDDVQLILMDPKKVEFEPYLYLPFYVAAQANEIIDTNACLEDLTTEMKTRFERLKKLNVKNVDDFISQPDNKMPYVVVICDEFCELMNCENTEKLILPLLEKGQDVGIYFVLATQRPSDDVFTPKIRKLVKSRICFQVLAKKDSKLMLNETGAEKLHGMGDMLIKTQDDNAIIKAQGYYISFEEIKKFLKEIIC